MVLKESEEEEVNMDKKVTYPNAPLKLNVWEGTCEMSLSPEGKLTIKTGTGDWWGGALEIQSKGENLSNCYKGRLFFDIKGDTSSSFQIGFQTGIFSNGNQVNNGVTFGYNGSCKVSDNWKTYSIPITELNKKGDLDNVTAILYLLGKENFDGKTISLKNIYYTKE
ncbi:hypothetical protein [Sediminicola arcticus]|uniref:Carbohydrate binding domain-containing protein n=1 Tax=Sediminicola arcticus TaxID=1574308 RepID=A0ABV2SU75_9FLAO